MNYEIEYAGLSVKGPFRRRNEDNLLCDGTCFPAAHGDRELQGAWQVSSSGKWLAVFDGIGGEAKGEEASYQAASWLAENGDREQDPARAAIQMNRAVYQYAQGHKLYGTGTTAAALYFGSDRISGFNVGDSRCYLLSEGRMQRLSQDHAKFAGRPQRRRLTQYLGVGESDFLIMPQDFQREYRDGDLYMLCTDGVTDVMIDTKIRSLLRADTTLQQKLDKIRARLASRGTPDNATVVLARVRRNPHGER